MACDPFSTRSARALTSVLADLGLIEPGQRIRIQRTRAGHWQRSAGAWSWAADDEKGNEICGSPYPVKEILEAHRNPNQYVSVHPHHLHGDISLYPERRKS